MATTTLCLIYVLGLPFISSQKIAPSTRRAVFIPLFPPFRPVVLLASAASALELFRIATQQIGAAPASHLSRHPGPGCWVRTLPLLLVRPVSLAKLLDWAKSRASRAQLAGELNVALPVKVKTHMRNRQDVSTVPINSSSIVSTAEGLALQPKFGVFFLACTAMRGTHPIFSLRRHSVLWSGISPKG